MQAKFLSGDGLDRGNSADGGVRDNQVDYRRAVRLEILRHLSSSKVDVSIERVALCLDLPVRTLQRRLAIYDVTFSDLVDECRHSKACEMLESSRFPISEIGKRLGYSDPAHFARAFRRWSDLTPSEYRKQATPPHC